MTSATPKSSAAPKSREKKLSSNEKKTSSRKKKYSFDNLNGLSESSVIAYLRWKDQKEAANCDSEDAKSQEASSEASVANDPYYPCDPILFGHDPETTPRFSVDKSLDPLLLILLLLLGHPWPLPLLQGHPMPLPP